MTDDDVINLIILHEGGTYTNDPADAGGPTRWGITIPVLAAFRRVPVTAIRAKDIMNLTREEATEVYRFLFVRPFDMLPAGQLRVNVIDMGVNAGVGASARLLQKTVGAMVDGNIGKETLRLVGTMNWNPVFVGMRIGFYERLVEVKPTNLKWRRGWRNRALSFLPPLSVHTLRPRTMQEKKFAPRFGATGKAYGVAA